MDALVTTAWLAAEIAAPDLRIVDASWFLPGDGHGAEVEFAAAHIPGAVFLDLAELVDTADPAPMMLPPAEAFAAAMARLGIGDGCRVVLYDASPHHTAARAWLMLRSFGMRETALLDGGFAGWLREGRAVESGIPAPLPAKTIAGSGGIGIVAREEVRRALDTGLAQVVDARSPSRFAGEEPEPRAGVVPGHMPGAANLHYALLFHPDDTWKRGEDLRAAFTAAGVDLDRPVITTCGSGVTAAALAFALHLLGREARVYDGSWAEWGADPTTPKAQGRA